MNKIVLTLLTLFGLTASPRAQIITVEPTFPRVGDAVTITFDATQGTGGLANCNCDVYVHTGVITNASSSSSDWKNVVTQWGVANAAWRMERVAGQPNRYRYTIAPSIRQFYNIGAGVEVQKLAFVFRDATGGREGKDTGGRDIFYDVYADDVAFVALLQSPSQQNIVAAPGQIIPIRLTTSRDATITVSDNGVQLTQTTGRTLSYDLTVTERGTHRVEITAVSGDDRETFFFNYAVPLDLAAAEPPAGAEPGITLLGDTQLRLLLYAPGKNNVFVVGDFNDWIPDTDYQMRPTPDGNSFWIEIGGLTPGDHYRFQYLVDGQILIADPYSKIVLDPANDRFINDMTYPGLPPYPEGLTSGIVTLVQPGAPAYEWAVDDFERPAPEKLVVYELLVRDFVARHDYSTLIDTLDYLDRLGVNAIELLPVNEFEGNISWGYNPSFHLALDKYYGPANEFKRFVDSCHARGIAVIVDVVYNHAFGQSPLARLYWDAAQNRPAADNPWLNPVATHPFNVGFDFNHQSAATRTYVDAALRYWLSEFRLDGFRFDLSKGFTQRVSADVNSWNRYDADRIATLKRYADVVWETTPGAYVILEHFAENREDQELAEYGALLWAGFDPHNNYLEAAMGYPSNFNSASYRQRGWTEPSLIVYMESHDEERLVYKNRTFGNSQGAYSTRNLPTALNRAELASAFFYTIPGPKMLWQFGELGYDFSINYCPNGTINNSCRTDPKPIRWDYYNDPDRRDLYDVTRALIKLKTDYEVFNTTDFTLNVDRRDWKTIFLRHPEMNVAVQGNFDVAPTQAPNPFPNTGMWYEYFSGDSLLVTSTATPMPLAPGEYRLYTTRRLQQPDRTTSRPALAREAFRLSVFPNPSDGRAVVSYVLDAAAAVRMDVFDLLGRRVLTLADQRQGAGAHQLELPDRLAPGAYVLRLTVGNRVETERLVVGE